MAEQIQQDLQDVSLTGIRNDLDKLERREWWRWMMALFIILILTAGILMVVPGGVPRFAPLDRAADSRILVGLLGVVMLFVLFVIYQQVVIGRIRRQLTTKIAAVATMEALKPLSSDQEGGRSERRRYSRWPVDELLRLTHDVRGKQVTVYGRVRDVSEAGLGAVIPDELETGSTALLRFELPDRTPLALQGTVRHRRGFHYGFQLTDLTSADAEHLRNFIMADIDA